MAKAIMISDHVYMELTELKKEGESYTKVIDKLLHAKKKKNIMDFAGAWSFLSDERTKEIETGAKKARKDWGDILK
ncbi:antitoxin VapB family protein [Candidatus Micrarchaeota archaeon]|nr:antitoxin VapB family protein [Candidatus Micrarchaeota archaeon]